MSKKRKQQTDKDGNLTLFELPPERSVADVNTDGVHAARTGQRLPGELMEQIRKKAKAVSGVPGPTEWDVFRGYDWRVQDSAAVKKENAFVTGLVAVAVEEGFRLAIERYANELRSVPELAKWVRSRDAGGDKGRDTQKQTKATRAARAQSMLSDGIDVAAIARELGCSIQTVYRYLKPAAAKPTPAKPRKRSTRSHPR
jgi:DNA-binding CsgD family transcriptional regulator